MMLKLLYNQNNLNQLWNLQQRLISALYITGDKANQNYAPLQPYVDLEATFADKESLENSIRDRKLSINLNEVLKKYTIFQEFNENIKKLETKRDVLQNRIKELTKAGAADAERKPLNETSKALRNELKTLKQNFYPIEDEFMHDVLNLPNKLHRDCPSDMREKLLYRNAMPRVEQGECHLLHKELIDFIDNNRYYMLKDAANFDITATQAMTRYFADAGEFLQMANPDFVRCVLLEANATPLQHYQQVREEQLQNKINVAYLTGGGAFESYLGAVTKLCVYPSVLPLRFVCCGRSYNRADMEQYGPISNLYTAIQSNAVQTFVATQTATEADQEVERILNLVVDFYKALKIHFRIVYVDASALSNSECLRANIEVYSPTQERYIAVGHVSNYGDYVSRRILFSMRNEKNYHFLHLVGGPLLYTTRLIAALIENGVSLSDSNLLGSINSSTSNDNEANGMKSAIEDFKNIFN